MRLTIKIKAHVYEYSYKTTSITHNYTTSIMSYRYPTMNLDERRFVANYVLNHPTEDARHTADKLLPAFKPRLDYCDVLNEILSWKNRLR